jgi:hypothetical protein
MNSIVVRFEKTRMSGLVLQAEQQCVDVSPLFVSTTMTPTNSSRGALCEWQSWRTNATEAAIWTDGVIARNHFESGVVFATAMLHHPLHTIRGFSIGKKEQSRVGSSIRPLVFTEQPDKQLGATFVDSDL